jgi:hypothetical protein
MFLGGACLAAALCGCQSNQKPHQDAREDGIFMPDPNAHQLWTILEAQSITGAQADAMLYAHHFDGDRLNSLGTQKLEMMLDGSARPAACISIWRTVIHASRHAVPASSSGSVTPALPPMRWLSRTAPIRDRRAGGGRFDAYVQDRKSPCPKHDLRRLHGSSSFQPQGMSPNGGSGNSY